MKYYLFLLFISIIYLFYFKMMYTIIQSKGDKTAHAREEELVLQVGTIHLALP